MQSSSFTILIRYRNFGTGVGLGTEEEGTEEERVEEEGTEEEGAEEEGSEVVEEKGSEKGGGSGQKLLPQ